MDAWQALQGIVPPARRNTFRYLVANWLSLSSRQGSNLRPPGSKPGALPAALLLVSAGQSIDVDSVRLRGRRRPLSYPHVPQFSGKDSNLAPPGSEPGVLPTELPESPKGWTRTTNVPV